MADGTEWLAVLQWAVARLTPTNSEADAAVKALLGGRIYERPAVQGAAYPMILLSLLSWGNDVRPNQGRVLTDPLVLVEAVAESGSWTGSLATLGAWIGAKMPTALEVTVANGVVRGCFRERPFSLVEPAADGRVYRRVGGEYRVLVA
jgi:hypothetical protein